jgi:hypothetical protein
MTREEAKAIVFNDLEPYVLNHIELEIDSKYIHRKAVINFVDEIYNDFESRTCENCKHWNGNEECELLVYDYCINDYCDDRCITTSPSFSCNKWEDKNENKD